MSENWQHLHPYAQGQPLPTTPDPVPRGYLDGRRMAVRVPHADYPSGYLGTLNTRRQDRLLEALSRRQAARSYTRGVHAGSRANPEHYVWPDEFGPMNGVYAQAAGVKQRPLLELAPAPTLVNDGKPGPQDVPRGAQSLIDLKSRQNIRPPWR